VTPTRIRCAECAWPDNWLWYCAPLPGGRQWAIGGPGAHWHCVRCGAIHGPAELASWLYHAGVIVGEVVIRAS
jgi:hypothetical protein